MQRLYPWSQARGAETVLVDTLSGGVGVARWSLRTELRSLQQQLRKSRCQQREMVLPR